MERERGPAVQCERALTRRNRRPVLSQLLSEIYDRARQRYYASLYYLMVMCRRRSKTEQFRR